MCSVRAMASCFNRQTASRCACRTHANAWMTPHKETAKPENCHFYRLIAYLQTRRTYVVEEGFYEGRAVLIVNEVTGRKTLLRGVPHYSPDNRLFVVSDNCEANGDIRWRFARGE